MSQKTVKSTQVQGKRAERPKKSKDGPCPFLCEMMPANVPNPCSVQHILHPRKDVFVLKDYVQLGNNLADSLAKEGVKKQVNNDVVALCKPSAMEVRELLRNHTEQEQQNMWDRKGDCKHAKAALPTLNRKTTNKLLKLQRQDLRLLVGLITGHCNLKSHLYKLGATDSPLCRGCMQKNETVEHVLWHCEATEETRVATGLHGVAKVGANGDRHCKMELELVTPKNPEKKIPERVDTRETQCDPDPPPCHCCGAKPKSKRK